MHKALAGGLTSTSLFAQRDTPGGMTLSHVWMGANFLIYRHSHPRGGDCLYYVVAGEVSLGRRKLRAGSTVFLPSGMPYKFRAGPAGAEVLEFRAGGGDPNAPGLKLEEHSLDSLQNLIDEGKAHRHEWGSARKDRRHGIAPGGDGCARRRLAPIAGYGSRDYAHPHRNHRAPPWLNRKNIR